MAGTYVRVHGTVSNDGGRRRLTAIKIRAIEDFNEVRAAQKSACCFHPDLLKLMPSRKTGSSCLMLPEADWLPVFEWGPLLF